MLFSTEDGFKEALLGVYTRCAASDLYGKELSVGTLEVLAQNYSIATADGLRYNQTKSFRYTDPNFIQRKDNVWKGLYNGIVNCNLILQEIDANQKLFSGDNYRLIKGEALALRAYLHFDALRLFAPAFGVAAGAPAIPYVTTYGNRVTALSNVSQVLDAVIDDLNTAKALLEDDPIRQASYRIGYPTVTDTLQNTELGNSQLFLQNRRHRLNYYAICGVLARVYLYKDEKSLALEAALSVINAGKFMWTNATDFLAVDDDKKDRIFYKELLFGWYVPGMNVAYNVEWFQQGAGGMYLEQEDTRAIYETSTVGGTDMRYTQWFNTSSVGSAYISTVQKYRRNTFSDSFNANLHYLMAPGIRLSELYYIAAECTYDTNPAHAAALIDEVREHRGIGQKIQFADAAAFRRELLKEYRKEMYGEGQLFFAYKRLNTAIVGLQGTLIPASQNIFNWPLPDDEIMYGQR
ncbi:hypothetical protein GCM10017764_29690 [Sphingobacterium griseoflavum]|uniref:RagB/SusD family nutrient uptake outer membrane protein n=1 Tax=Sphingobacterium griseoflavum TaxID=1474952 RepID=A0ABQ3HXH3_9SPHI|nr:hypothetical protein GCM10017764_29690 [Sphingobacterium griseoflavum]